MTTLYLGSRTALNQSKIADYCHHSTLWDIRTL